MPVVDNRCAGIARKRMFNGHYARMYTLYTLYTWKIQGQEQVGIQNIRQKMSRFRVSLYYVYLKYYLYIDIFIYK